MGDAVALHHRPDPIRTGIIRGPLENDKRDPVEPAADDFPRSHHPTDIGEPPHQVVASAHIEVVSQLLAHLDHASGMGVDGAFRFPRGTTGIDHQRRIHRAHYLGHRIVIEGSHRFMPPQIPVAFHRCESICTLEHDHVFNRLDTIDRQVCLFLERKLLTSSHSEIRGEQQTRSRIDQSFSYRRSSVAAEDGNEDGSNLHRRQHREDHLADHRHQACNAIATFDAQVPQQICQTVDLL